ncbi:MAG TPA: hypothetical protein VGU22_11675 [Methylomirabilota bacterium]|jgi:uncharacterized protein YciI|nr:hypothetical protein [Methylomirabilota bacterium]
MTVFHVAVTCCEDYLERRRAGREAHHAQLEAWRERRLLVGGGPAPDGRTVDLFWQAEDAEAVAQLMREDQFVADGLWVSFVGRPFADFLGTLEMPPLDGSRLTVILEGRVADPALAAKSLLTLRDEGRVAFGGVFPEGDGLALGLTADTREALRWLAAAEGWIADGLVARAFYYVL